MNNTNIPTNISHIFMHFYLSNLASLCSGLLGSKRDTLSVFFLPFLFAWRMLGQPHLQHYHVTKDNRRESRRPGPLMGAQCVFLHMRINRWFVVATSCASVIFLSDYWTCYDTAIVKNALLFFLFASIHIPCVILFFSLLDHKPLYFYWLYF